MCFDFKELLKMFDSSCHKKLDNGWTKCPLSVNLSNMDQSVSFTTIGVCIQRFLLLIYIEPLLLNAAADSGLLMMSFVVFHAQLAHNSNKCWKSPQNVPLIHALQSALRSVSHAKLFCAPGRLLSCGSQTFPERASRGNPSYKLGC